MSVNSYRVINSIGDACKKLCLYATNGWTVPLMKNRYDRYAHICM